MAGLALFWARADQCQTSHELDFKVGLSFILFCKWLGKKYIITFLKTNNCEWPKEWILMKAWLFLCFQAPKCEEVLLGGESAHCKAGEDTCFYSGSVAKNV